MANHDRVADLYFGRIDQVETQTACRDRIHWMCEKARGERVLDVGCSQGVVPLILAREGRRVVGIDIETPAIAAARKTISQEPPLVQERVAFFQVDAYTADFPPNSFDSIIVGEILEHLINPEKLLARIAEWLVDGGHLVVSVPFGYHPHFDHKRTFYLTHLLDLLVTRFNIEEIEVLQGRYLCAVATKPSAGTPLTPPRIEKLQEWSRMCDRGLEQMQRRHHRESNAARKARKKLLQAVETYKTEIEKMNAEHDDLEKPLREKYERRTRYLKDRVAQLEELLNVRLNEVRYRLGDTLVSAVTNWRDALKLPYRIVKLFLEGLAKRALRNQESVAFGIKDKGDSRNAVLPPKPLPEWLGSLEPPQELDKPFSQADVEKIARKKLRVAGVMDEFSWRAWQYEADFYTFTPQNWKEVLEEKKPDLLLIESAWQGIAGAWHFQVRDLGKRPDIIKHYVLPDIVEWCRQREIPTVFYNKEDPPNFEFFVDAASLFDYVFTSDANCIADYRERLGHDRVAALPFAAQPRIHNPIQTGERAGSICFAGTWYSHRHHHRQNAAEVILKPALAFGLHIFDRMADNPNQNYRWPTTYQRFVYGALPYEKMLAAYKRFKAFLNVNSVTDSPTMFSRRVFELLASGTPVVSAYSLGIEKLLGSDVVLMSQDEKTTANLLQRLLTDTEYRERLSLLGQRKVFSEHTYTRRLETILEAVGIPFGPIERPKMTFIATVEKHGDALNAWQNFCRQTCEDTELILCTNDSRLATECAGVVQTDRRARIVHIDNADWGEILAKAFSEVREGLIAAMNPDDYYGPDYLTDYVHATMFLDDEAIGKQRYYVAKDDQQPSIVAQGRDYRFVEEVCPWTLCLRIDNSASLCERLKGVTTPSEWWEQAMRTRNRVYSSDAFNYVRNSKPPMERASSNGNGLVNEEESRDRLATALV